MLDVYSVEPVARKLPLVIDALSSNDRCLYAGTKNGFLISYSPKANNETAGISTQGYSMHMQKSFSKKSVVQLEVIPQLNLLLCLSDNVIQIHDYGQVNFPVLSIMAKSKGATEFRVSLLPQDEHSGQAETRLILAVAIRRKCGFYIWDKSEFVEYSPLVNISFNDNIRRMVFYDNFLVFAVRDEYFYANIIGIARRLHSVRQFLWKACNKRRLRKYPVVRNTDARR
ncbi:unnamed protein product [Soboliphyme baturini]|uniref:CNH domain-containing protein n=1 Tax=Soboliphyme baturini TaxID=241478 RepID=A0A183IBV0_9BILA|nr:unnamed protein product [Soboliphyme baturini]